MGERPNLREPGAFDGVEQGEESVFVQDVGGAEPGNHAKETELSLMEAGSGRESPGDEVDGGSGSGRRQLE